MVLILWTRPICVITLFDVDAIKSQSSSVPVEGSHRSPPSTIRSTLTSRCLKTSARSVIIVGWRETLNVTHPQFNSLYLSIECCNMLMRRICRQRVFFFFFRCSCLCAFRGQFRWTCSPAAVTLLESHISKKEHRRQQKELTLGVVSPLLAQRVPFGSKYSGLGVRFGRVGEYQQRGGMGYHNRDKHVFERMSSFHP